MIKPFSHWIKWWKQGRALNKLANKPITKIFPEKFLKYPEFIELSKSIFNIKFYWPVSKSKLNMYNCWLFLKNDGSTLKFQTPKTFQIYQPHWKSLLWKNFRTWLWRSWNIVWHTDRLLNMKIFVESFNFSRDLRLLNFFN